MSTSSDIVGSLLHRLGVAGSARVRPLAGTGMPKVGQAGRLVLPTRVAGSAFVSREGLLALSRVLLGSVLVLAFALAGLLALTAVPASAYETHVLSTSFSGSGSTALSDPQGVGIDQSTGEVYVVDSANNRVEIFSASGAFISAFGADVGGPGINTCTTGCAAGTAGSGNGQFNSPAEVAVDNSTGMPGDVYVLDRGNERVEVFNAKGEYQAQITEGDLAATNPPGGAGSIADTAVDASGNFWIYGPKSGQGNQTGIMYEFPPGGASPGRFSFATKYAAERGGMAIDPSGDLFVPRGIPVVEEFTSSGTDLGQVGNVSPNGLAVDSATGDLYVDQGNYVDHYAFPVTGGLATDVFGSESGRPALSAGVGVAVAAVSGDVYVVDAASNRVDIFVPATLPDTTTKSLSEKSGRGRIM